MVVFQDAVINLLNCYNILRKKGLRGKSDFLSTPNFIGVILLVPRAGVEPARTQGARDFKSRVSTNSTIQALGWLLLPYPARHCQSPSVAGLQSKLTMKKGCLLRIKAAYPPDELSLACPVPPYPGR